MKYLKSYENIKLEPKVGDYVIIISWSTNIDLSTFVNNTIGKIDRIIGSDISVKYDFESIEKAGLNFANNRLIFNKSQIKYCAKTKEELELILTIKKYNI